MSHFLVCSASGSIVSLLNPVDIHPYDALVSHISHLAPLTTATPSTAATSRNRQPATQDNHLPAPHTLVPVASKRRYKCSECSKTLSTSGHLSRHFRVHTGEKDYTCPFPDCSALCSRQDNLVQHYSLHLTKAERRRGNTFVRRALNRMLDASRGIREGESSEKEDGSPHARQLSGSSVDYTMTTTESSLSGQSDRQQS